MKELLVETLKREKREKSRDDELSFKQSNCTSLFRRLTICINREDQLKAVVALQRLCFLLCLTPAPQYKIMHDVMILSEEVAGAREHKH